MVSKAENLNKKVSEPVKIPPLTGPEKRMIKRRLYEQKGLLTWLANLPRETEKIRAHFGDGAF